MFIGSRTVLGAMCTSWMSCHMRPNMIQDTRVDTNREAGFDDLQHLRDHYGRKKSRQGLVKVRHWDFILRWGWRTSGGLSKGEMSFNLELWSVILASMWEAEWSVRGWWFWWSGWPPSQGTVLGRRHCEDMKCKDGGYSQGEPLLDVGPEGKGCGGEAVF